MSCWNLIGELLGLKHTDNDYSRAGVVVVVVVVLFMSLPWPYLACLKVRKEVDGETERGSTTPIYAKGAPTSCKIMLQLHFPQ